MITDTQREAHARWRQLRDAIIDEIASIDQTTSAFDRLQDWWRDMLAVLQKIRSTHE